MPQLTDRQEPPAPAAPPVAEPSMEQLRARVRQLETNVENLLFHVVHTKRPCKACGVMLWFVTTPPFFQGEKTILPLEYDGRNHFDSKCGRAPK